MRTIDWNQAYFIFGASMLALAQAGAVHAQATPADSASANAQDEPPANEIVVTANKREQSINDVGLSITAASGESLVTRGINSPMDLGKIVPGLTVQPSPFNTPVYTLRGVGFYETTLSAAPTVAVYADEVALPFSATTRGAAFDIQRVEVLKGPQGTLFGQNTTGGAINYIVNKPTDTLSAGADMSFGRFNVIDAQGFISGPLANGINARLAVRGVHGGEWQNSFTRNDKLGRTRMLQGRLLLDIEASDRLKLAINVNGWKDNGDTQAAQLQSDNCNGSLAGTCGSPDATNFRLYPRAPADPQAADWGYGIFGRRPQRDDGFWQASLRADYEINDHLSLTSISAYSRYTTDSVQDFDGARFASADTNTTGYIKNFAQELRINGKYDRLNFILGANYNHADTYDRLFYNFSQGPSSNPLYSIPNAPRGVLTYNDSAQKVRDIGVFFNAEYEIAQRLTLIGGARYTDSRRSFVGCTHDFGGETAVWWNAIFGTTVKTGECITFDPGFVPYGPNALQQDLNEHNISWNVGLNYKTDGGTLLYARVAKGFKAGSFPTASVATFRGYAPVKQESVLSYEAGFKAPIADRRVELTAAVFYYDYKDKQLRGRLPDPVFGTLDGLVQVPKSHLWGVEASLLARPIEGLTLSLGGTYIKTKITQFQGFDPSGNLKDFNGQTFPYAPEITFTGDLEYKVPVSDRAKAYFGVSVTHNSSSTTSLANTNTTFSNAALSVVADRRFDMKAYTLADLRAGVEFNEGKLRVGGYVRNVGNTYYWTNTQDTLASIVRYAGMPRTYGVQLAWRY